MFIRNLIFFSGITLALSTSFKHLAKSDISVIQRKVDYQVTENFEYAVKGSYAATDIEMPTGSWNLDNALIGNSAADLKNGSRSVRLKTGSLSMNFDVSNIHKLYISHGLYGKDPASRWKLMVSLDGGINYSQVGNTILEANRALVTDTFMLKPFYKMRFKIEHSGSTAAARINIDDITFIELAKHEAIRPADSLNTDAQSFSGRSRGIIYDYDAQPEKGDNSNMLFGNPSRATTTTPENYFLDLKYYTSSYSRSRAIPNWVSWHLDSSTTTRRADRLDNFAGFNELPPDFYTAQSNSYAGSGFDRGHNCPSADRSSSRAANSATFLMINMVPQAPRNNQRTWASFENYLRTLVEAGNEAYIIMGNYGAGGVGSKGLASSIANGNIAVPAYLWKVAVILPVGNGDLSRVNADTRVIAINTTNVNTVDPDWRKYLSTVNEIEKATGYDLLSTLPERIQTIVEQRKDAGL